jgi:hypothetical protein
MAKTPFEPGGFWDFNNHTPKASTTSADALSDSPSKVLDYWGETTLVIATGVDLGNGGEHVPVVLTGVAFDFPPSWVNFG